MNTFKNFIISTFTILLCLVFSCSETTKKKIEPYTINIKVDQPKEGEIAVFVPDSVSRDRSKWKPYHKIDSSGILKITDTITEPEFFYFQLGKTPVLTNLIIYPGNVIDIDINNDTIIVRSNKDQKILDKYTQDFPKLKSENYHSYYVENFKKSPVLLKGLQNWTYKEEITPEIEELVHFFAKNHKDWKISKKMEEKINSLKTFNIGTQVKGFDLPDSIGTHTSLKDFTGKYVLLDFWGSWCVPCIAEFPKMKEIYNKYKSDKFEIVGIAVDDKEKWMEALNKLEINWVNVLDPEGATAKAYNVRSYPSTYLIDPKGKLIAKNLKANGNLEEVLKSVLNLQKH